MPTPTFPVAHKFSEKTSARYGYKDGRFEIDTKLGFIPAGTSLTLAELREAVPFMVDALKFGEMSEADRSRLGAD